MRSYKFPCHAVTLVLIAKGIVPTKAVAVHDSLHQTADVEEADLILKEELDGLLVGTVGGAGAETALLVILFYYKCNKITTFYYSKSNISSVSIPDIRPETI